MSLTNDNWPSKIELVVGKPTVVNLGFFFKLRYQFMTLFSKIIYRAQRMAYEREENLNAIANLKKDITANSEIRSGYTDHYTEEREFDVFKKYTRLFDEQMKAGDNTFKSEVVYRAHFVRNEVSKLITNDTTIKNVVNFGCSYGWLEN